MAAVVKFMAKTVVPIAGLIAAEHYFLRTKVPKLYEISSALPVIPRAYAAVLVANLVLSGFLLIYLGLQVASARTTYKEKAAKDGDKDAEERFSYPKMYAEGFSQHAKQFNCVQRGHQQALETYTFFVVGSVIGGFKFPVTTALAGVLWLVARYVWARGYKTGEPSNRYQNFLSHGIWTSLLMVMATTLSTAVWLAVW